MEQELAQMEQAVPAQGGPGTPGREAEDVPVDGESPSPSPDDDRNLTPSEEGEGPVERPEVKAERTKVVESEPESDQPYQPRWYGCRQRAPDAIWHARQAALTRARPRVARGGYRGAVR